MKADHPYFNSAVELQAAIEALSRAKQSLEDNYGDSASTFLSLGMRRLTMSMENLYQAERQQWQRGKK